MAFWPSWKKADQEELKESVPEEDTGKVAIATPTLGEEENLEENGSRNEFSRPSVRTAGPGQRSSFRSFRRQSTSSSQSEQEKKGTFLDAAAMKDKVRQKLIKKRYDVCDFYKEHGVWQAIARNSNFEKLTLTVIVLNAFWIALDTELNTHDLLVTANPVFQFAENMFCAFFSFEWFTRCLSFRRKADGLSDAWFVFDGLMCVLMVLETWLFSAYILIFTNASGGGMGGTGSLLRIARLMRLSRMFRMAKLVRAMPELFVMLKGLFAAARSVFFTLVLLAALLFIFAIVFTQLTARTPLGALFFPTVQESMYFLLLHATLRGPSGMLSTDSKLAVVREMGNFWLMWLFFGFVLLASVLLMNMLIGVLCEVVSAVASTEKEEMLVAYVGVRLTKVMALIDEDGGGTISRDEFMQILDSEEAIEALQEVGVDVIGLVDFADFIFGGDVEQDEDTPEVELTMPEFMEVVLQLRGSNSATVKDIVDLRKFVRTSLQLTEKRLEQLDARSDQALDMISESTGLITELHNTLAADLHAQQAGSFGRQLPMVQGFWHADEVPELRFLSPIPGNTAAVNGEEVQDEVAFIQAGNHGGAELERKGEENGWKGDEAVHYSNNVAG
eukprot:TRINITY_DN9967_c1_g2_i1.p1 TRINITY_DN9967_c1_g2~~TRINITY_DN9967_c1_g2_i1.p1  ORF type:complete len:615 (-),score=165.34 TRINITY_DN9967_c1_g2_i1:39-1883(-)